ncbi:hypothetical protein BC831DRAFT_465542 [Entophlyctis helioformis]|nr:hypothetical protein BC831DRAFT_465542 [Entophlyctis helioformis]
MGAEMSPNDFWTFSLNMWFKARLPRLCISAVWAAGAGAACFTGAGAAFWTGAACLTGAGAAFCTGAAAFCWTGAL